MGRYLLAVKRLYAPRHQALRRIGRVLMLSGFLVSAASLLEATVLVGLVAFAAGSEVPLGLNTPSLISACILLRFAAAYGGAYITAQDSKKVREALSLTTLERFSHLPWNVRTSLDPSEIRLMTLVLPQEVSNARHGLTTSFSAVTSSIALAVVALAMSPSLIPPVIAGTPIILLMTIRRGKRSMRFSSKSNEARFDLGAYNEILPFGFEELRPSSRLSTFTREYSSLVKSEAKWVYRLRMVQARGPIGLTTSVYFIFLIALQVFNGFNDAQNLASLLVLIRVLLNLQSVLLLPGYLSDYFIFAVKFESKLQVLDISQDRDSHQLTAASGLNSTRVDETCSGPDLAQLRDVRVQFSEHSMVGPITMNVPSSGITLLWGPSGSGKTTIGRVLIGDLQPTSGSVARSDRFTPDHIRFVPQSPAITDKSLPDNLSFWLPYADRNEIKQLIARLGLESRVDDSDLGLDESKVGLSRISGGERLRVGLARAILGMNEGLLVVDEPTAALDAISRRLVMDLLQSLSQDISIVVISHDEDFKRISDQVVELSNDK